jgi:hypothetical protein
MDLGKVYVNQTETTVFYVMRNQVGWKALYLGDELKRYVDIHYLQVDDDWNIDPGKNTQTIIRYEAKQCEPSDFGPSEREQHIFSLWVGFSLVCPDIPKDKSLYMVGDVNEWVSSKYEFRIDRCTNDTIKNQTNGRLTCHPPEEIDAMVKNYQIDSWLVDSQMDYSRMHDNPTFKALSLIESLHLDNQ